MKDLQYVRPSYETWGDRDPAQLEDAHRGVRMAVAVGEVLGVPFETVGRARDAIERVENSMDDVRRLTAPEVAALADLVTQTQEKLDASLDDRNRPSGDGGQLIVEEASKPIKLDSGESDFDR